MLNWTERIIRMRKEVPEIGWGDFEIIATRDPAVFVIRYDWRNNSVLFVHNLDEKPREISFSTGLPGDDGKHLINLLAEDHSEANGRGQHRIAHGTLWLSLVPRWRAGLSVEAQRHRRQGEASGRSPGLSPLADNHAFIAAQVERALYPFTLPVQQCRQQNFAAVADRARGDGGGLGSKIQRNDDAAPSPLRR